MAELFNNVLLKGATGQPIYPQTLMDNVYVQTAANGTVEGQQTLRQWLALNYVGLSILTATSLDSITDPKLNIIYFIPSDDADAGSYILYIYHKGADGTALGTFLAIGSTDLDLSEYVTLTELENALKNYYTKAEADAQFIDTELIKNYYTKDEADNKFIDTELIANYQPKGDYVLVTDVANAERNAEAGSFTYAASIANQVAAQFVADPINTEIAKGLTIGTPYYANPIAYQVMQTITAMGDDSSPSSATNWLFDAIAGLGFVTDSPADDPGTAPYIVASTAGFGYWFNLTLTEVNNGTYSGTSFDTSFDTYLGARLEDTGALALSVLTGVANASDLASDANNGVASDIVKILGNFSSLGALVVDVTSLNDKIIGSHVPLLFYVAGDIDGICASLAYASDTRSAFEIAVNNSIFFTKLHADCKDDIVLMIGRWLELNLSMDATDTEGIGSGGAGLAERAGNGIATACLDTVSDDLAAERIAKDWSTLTPQNLADSLIKFLAKHNFMYYEVILELPQA